MKKTVTLILSAILGSAITLGSFLLFDIKDSNTVKVEHISGVPAVGAAYTVDEEGEIVPLEFTDVAANVMPAVVHIKSTRVTRRPGNRQPGYPGFDDDILRRFFGPEFDAPGRGDQMVPRVGSGSGVIVSTDGYIVTNNHVVDRADDIEVALNDNRVYKARVVGTDPSTDLALLQIKENGLPALPLVNSDDVEVGEWVLAVGNPFNLNSTVTAGIVSAKARNINILQDRSAIESFIQTDAAINMGNSGGALVNLQGGLIGISTAIASPTGAYAGYGFAVPSNIVSKVIEDLMEYGTVQRGYLGLMIRNVDGNLAREEDLDLTQGVYVDSITAESAAGEAGIRVGDVITEIDGSEVKTSGKLLEMIGLKRPGDRVELTVNRNGRERQYTVELKSASGTTGIVRAETAEVLEVLGVELETIDRRTARALDIPGGVKIVSLNDGKLRNTTDIREGYIITSVDGKPVRSKEELIDMLEGKKGGVMFEGVYEDLPGVYYYAFGL